jgi:hypothetical protein
MHVLMCNTKCLHTHAGMVEFAKHLILFRWGHLFSDDEYREVLSWDEDWIAPIGRKYWVHD